MSLVTTPHINAEKDAFGKTVLMPGDPLRSKFIAENFLENAVLVNNIMRIGSTGAMQEKVKIRDIVFGMGACTNSNYASQYGLNGTFAPIASYALLKEAIAQAERAGARYHVGNILSSDVFYNDDDAANEGWQKMGVLCVEMEAAALYMNAARCGKNALAMFTVSDSLVTGEATTAEERQNSFTQMMEIALNTAVNIETVSDHDII